MLESMGPKVNQYFIESDAEGRPFHRKFRSIIYQRAKQELDQSPRVMIGGGDCKQPYSASIFNISAMSYGSLSKNAVLALNGGAKTGGGVRS